MSDLEREQFMHELIGRTTKQLLIELKREDDELVMLRKALLLLILFTQDDCHRKVQQVITYLLQNFPPLADQFVDNHHDFVGGWKVGIAVHGNRTFLTIPDEFVPWIFRHNLD